MVALQGPVYDFATNVKYASFTLNHYNMTLHDSDGAMISQSLHKPFEDMQYTLKKVNGVMKKGNYTIVVSCYSNFPKQFATERYEGEERTKAQVLNQMALTIFKGGLQVPC